ncbi:uncharacterized protein LOC126837855 [Adelges cooleyi]|uniref:uncharacterized protein LOC126837855 n=1 Tax=Adelges cooleyi TaxID=133065 RepID=UPI00217F5BDD|nr:uncharacterized protein LOC126837855 [Adelges cooleyi]
MFKSFALVLALAVSASMAVKVQDTANVIIEAHKEAAKAASPQVDSAVDAVADSTYAHKTVVRPVSHIDKVVYYPPPPPPPQEVAFSKLQLLWPLLESGLATIVEKITVPKKLIAAGFTYVVTKLKAIGLKTIIKNVLVAAAVAVLAAVATVAVAGLVTIVSTICAVVPYMKPLLSKNGQESNMDSITSFALEAISKFDSQH